jgi:hypothetical protein
MLKVEDTPVAEVLKDVSASTAYKPNFFYDGRVRFEKKQWRVSYNFTFTALVSPKYCKSPFSS